jgi:hypothetical protein
MTGGRRDDGENLAGLEGLDASDALTGDPGEDPLDTGVITPDKWSSAMRFGSTADEESEGESLDQLLAEEEPDDSDSLPLDDERRPRTAPDENATEEDVARYASADGPDPRSGRLAAIDDAGHEEDDAYLAVSDELIAGDAGIDGGAASAEEAAVHVEDEDSRD